MNWTAIGWGAAFLLAVLILRKLMKSGKSARISYQKRDFLLSPEERQFYAALHQSVGEDYAIFVKIYIEDVISPHATSGADAAWDALEEEYFPFVLCNKSDLAIACAIQLIQHRIPGRKPGNMPDNPLKTVCQAAGLPLARLEAGPFYDHADIRQAIAEAVRKEPLFITESDGRKEPSISSLEKLEL